MQKNWIVTIILLCVIVVQKPILTYIASNNAIYKCTWKFPHFPFYTPLGILSNPGTREE
jgi:hypothetical protein